jgi:hypothetical protein
MSQSLHPLVRNQLLFREVNERVREALATHEGPIEFVCECSNGDCVDKVPLDVEAYERIRAHPNLFLVASGHETLEVDRVVDQGRDYVLVEKKVDVERIIAFDPRSRGEQ